MPLRVARARLQEKIPVPTSITQKKNEQVRVIFPFFQLHGDSGGVADSAQLLYEMWEHEAAWWFVYSSNNTGSTQGRVVYTGEST